MLPYAIIYVHTASQSRSQLTLKIIVTEIESSERESIGTSEDMLRYILCYLGCARTRGSTIWCSTLHMYSLQYVSSSTMPQRIKEYSAHQTLRMYVTAACLSYSRLVILLTAEQPRCQAFSLIWITFLDPRRGFFSV